MLTAMRAAGPVVETFHDALGMDSFLTATGSGNSPFLLETDETSIIIAGIHLGFLLTSGENGVGRLGAWFLL